MGTMIILSILAVLVAVLILVQSPKGISSFVTSRIGAKRNKSYLTKTTWGLVVVMLIAILSLS